MVVIRFAATTTDTGVRRQRFAVQELGEVTRITPLARDLSLATTIAVVISLGMALIAGGGSAGCTFGVLWQLLGTTDQLSAALALSVTVTRIGRNPTAILVPLVLLLGTTTRALLVDLRTSVRDDQWVLAPLDALILVLALWLDGEAGLALRERSAPGELLHASSAVPAGAVSRAKDPADRPLGESSQDDVR